MISKPSTLQFVNHVVGMPKRKDTTQMKKRFLRGTPWRQIFWIKCYSKAITLKLYQNMGGECGSNFRTPTFKEQFTLSYSLKACWILNTAQTLHIININVTFLQGKKSRLTPLLWLQYRSRQSLSEFTVWLKLTWTPVSSEHRHSKSFGYLNVPNVRRNWKKN